jgi:hypothetical protein
MVDEPCQAIPADGTVGRGQKKTHSAAMHCGVGFIASIQENTHGSLKEPHQRLKIKGGAATAPTDSVDTVRSS